ncbi:subtilase-type protease inhibitor [Streptomyces wedmorensis]|uniref:Probable subtilase-type protease inhibitor n=1 Tax=Streptomyces wedmorensis TaxID=43759 RepID=A0ABW6IMF6_STRWE
MRYFRTLGATVLATATGLALIGTACTGAAVASPASLYAPSALVLAVGEGDSPETATIVRAVTLSCAPVPGGTHPSPESACAELAATGGDLGALTVLAGGRPCTREWAPVTVTGDGVWQGRRVSWSETYGNACELRARTAAVAALSF